MKLILLSDAKFRARFGVEATPLAQGAAATAKGAARVPIQVMLVRRSMTLKRPTTKEVDTAEVRRITEPMKKSAQQPTGWRSSVHPLTGRDLATRRR